MTSLVAQTVNLGDTVARDTFSWQYGLQYGDSRKESPDLSLLHGAAAKSLWLHGQHFSHASRARRLDRQFLIGEEGKQMDKGEVLVYVRFCGHNTECSGSKTPNLQTIKALLLKA